VKLAALSVAALSLFAGGSSLKVTLTAPNHAPKIKVHWPYTVRETVNGKAVAARLTVQIVDPIGGVNPVQFDATKKNITNWRFVGVFRDYVIWPAASRDIPLRFRVTVVTAHAKKVLNYRVTPHA
jgi:hypothetical protein